MPPAGGDDGLRAPRHGVHQGVPPLHLDSPPGLLDGLTQLSYILGSDVGSSDVALEEIPKVLYWV